MNSFDIQSLKIIPNIEPGYFFVSLSLNCKFKPINPGLSRLILITHIKT